MIKEIKIKTPFSDLDEEYIAGLEAIGAKYYRNFRFPSTNYCK